MHTLNLRIGFLALLTLAAFSFTSCEKEEVAHAEITVVQEFTATQGQVLQTRPVEGAEVKFFVPLEGTEHLEAIEFTDVNGKATFKYEYQSLIIIDVSYLGIVQRESVRMEVGETSSKVITLPE